MTRRIAVGRTDPAPEAAAAILADLPEWFGRPESTAEYVADAGRMPTYLATREDGTAVGILLLHQHFPQSAEVHLMAVLREHHGEGVGRALVEAAAQDAAADGVRLLQVKTLGVADPDPHYAATRRFYEAVGFLPLEETVAFWGEDTPCLVMVKPLDLAGGTR